MIRRLFWMMALLSAALFLTHCGPPGGPVKDNCTTNDDCGEGKRCVRQVCKAYTPPNDAPVATIEGETSLRLRIGATIELDGSKSSDPNGDELTFAWSLLKRPDESKLDLADADQNKVSFTPDAEGLYVVQLVVTDKGGLPSAPARVEVDIYGKSENGDPIASAGSDIAGCVGEKVTLDGSSSSDSDGDELTYTWSFKSKPDGSSATIDNPDAVKPTFTPDVAGKYIMSLVVSDGLESSPEDTVSVDALTDCKLQPKLTNVTPNEGFVDAALTVKLEGDGFSENAAVLFNGVAVSEGDVKFVSPTELEVNLQLSGLLAKDYPIKVRNPNRLESNELQITVKELPTPTITKMTPDKSVEGAVMDVKIEGTGFVPNSEVLFSLVPLKTTVVSDTELTFKLDLRQTPPGQYDVQVRNPGGRVSKEVTFTVLSDIGAPPMLRVLNPPSGITDTKIAFSVHGTGFSEGSVIHFNGKEIPSKRIRRDEIQADPTLDLTGLPEGNYKVQVVTPSGKKSNIEEFVVEGKDPTPVLDRILPFFVYLDDSTNVLAVYGLKFRQGLTLKIGNTVISGADISFKSNTYFEAKVDTTKGTWAAGDYQTVIVNPNGKQSNPFKLTVTYRVPSISNVTPSGWTNGCDVKIEIFGSNFVPKASVKIGPLTYTTASATNKLTFVSDTKLELTVKKGQLTTTTHQIQVINGPSAASTKVTFRVTSQTGIPKPQIREARPASARADTKVSVLLYYQSPGTFRQGAVVLLNGKRQKTSCSSTSTTCYNLTAELDLTGLKPGKQELKVSNPCSNDSDPFPFYVSDAPKVYLSSIAPAFAKPGEKKRLVIKGINFTTKSAFYLDGKVVPTTYKSETELLTTGDVDFTGTTAGTTLDAYVDNGNGQKSGVLKYPILDANAKLYITSVSTTEFDRGKVHNGIAVSGNGFTANTEIYFNGKKVTAKYTSQFSMNVDGLDFTTLKAGLYYLYAQEGTDKSNEYPLLAKPAKEPLLEYTSPTTIYAGRPSTTFRVYGRYFCEPTTPSSSTCKQNPKIVILDANGTDLSSSFTLTRAYARPGWTYSGYAYGTLNTSTWKVGDYRVYFELPTGERSNPGVIVVKPPPPPTINYITPTGAKQGITIQVRAYGTNFAAGATVVIGLQTYSTTGSGSYVYANIDTTLLKEGTHQFVVRNPDGQTTKAVTFTVYPKTTPPLFFYSSPDVTYQGYSGTLYLYGQNLSSGMKLYINNVLTTHTYTASSTPYLRVSGFRPGASTGPYKIYAVDSTGAKSNVYELGNAGAKPFIRYISPDYRNTSSTSRFSLYVYGFGFNSTSQILFDGTPVSVSYRGTSYWRFYHTASGTNYKQHTVQIKTGTELSNTAIFSYIPSTAPYISSMRSTAVLAGVNTYPSGQFYVYGSRFNSTSQLYYDGKLVPTRLSGTTRLYINQALDFTTTTTAGMKFFEVRNGTVKSNAKPLRIETGISKLSRTRFRDVDPYVVSVGKTVTLSHSATGLSSSYLVYYQAIIEGPNSFSKAYPITYASGKYQVKIDTTGWTSGVYNVFVQNKATKEKSGGTGLYVAP